MKNKTKVYTINDINIDLNTDSKTESHTFTFQYNCYLVTYQTHPCTGDGHEYRDPSCDILGTSGAAQAPTIIDVINTCEGGGSGNPGAPGNVGSSPGSSLPSGFPQVGGYTTLIFASADYQYYNTEDLGDPNFVLYTQVNSYFASLGASSHLITLNPDIYYYTFMYFRDHGISPVTKAFITERLQGLYNWYTVVSNVPNAPWLENQIILNWAFQYVLENPTMSWQEFYSQFLATPCEKLTNNLQKAKELMDVPVVKNQNDIMKATIATDPNEKGFYFEKNSSGSYKVSNIVEGGVSGVNIVLSNAEFSPEAVVHNHNKLDGYTCFSPTDINSFHGYHAGFSTVSHYYVNGGDGSMYVMTIQNQQDYDNYLQQYSNSIDPDSGNWKNNSDLYKEKKKVLDHFRNLGKTEDEAFDLAMGYLNNKYNMGVVISKKGADGKFHPLQVESKKTTDPLTGETTTIYNPINPCNL